MSEDRKHTSISQAVETNVPAPRINRLRRRFSRVGAVPLLRCFADIHRNQVRRNPIPVIDLTCTETVSSSSEPTPKPSRSRNRGERKRYWCFTNFDTSDVKLDPKVVRYCVFQIEKCEKTGRLHKQGYLELYHNLRIGQVKSILGNSCHLSVRKGTRDEARNYCMKERTRMCAPVEFGHWRSTVFKKRKLDDMLADSDMSLTKLIAEDPSCFVYHHRGLTEYFHQRNAKRAKIFRPVEIQTIVGPTGTGKTRYAMQGDTFVMPMSDGNWMDGYREQKIFVIDDFYGNIAYHKFLRVADGHPLQMQVKGSFCHALYDVLRITSNKHPDQWYPKLFPNGMSPALKRRLTGQNGSAIYKMSPDGKTLVPYGPFVLPSAEFTRYVTNYSTSGSQVGSHSNIVIC